MFPVRPSILCSGAINLDITLHVRRFGAPGEEVEALAVQRYPGGTAANVAVAAARLLGLGRVSILGAVGADPIGEEQIKNLRSEGVETSAVIKIKTTHTGQAYIVIDGAGQNIIHTYLGANHALHSAQLRLKTIKQKISQARILVVTDPPLPFALALLRRFAAGEEKTSIWCPGVNVQLGPGKLAKPSEYADYLVFNRQEVERLVGSADLPALAKFFPRSKIVVKLGEEGCALLSREGILRVKGVDLRRLGLKVLSTVGCGDAFLGAFAAFKAEGLSDVEALNRANWAGAFKATRRETRGSPTLRELESFIARGVKVKAGWRR